MTFRTLLLASAFVLVLSPGFAQTQIMQTDMGRQNENTLSHWQNMSSSERRAAMRQMRTEQRAQAEKFRHMSNEQRQQQWQIQDPNRLVGQRAPIGQMVPQDQQMMNGADRGDYVPVPPANQQFGATQSDDREVPGR